MGKGMNPIVENRLLKEKIARLKKQIAEFDMYDQYVKGFTIQQMCDMGSIALHDEFGFGPERLKRFVIASRETFVHYAEMCLVDGGVTSWESRMRAKLLGLEQPKGDDDITYTKEKLDRKLKECFGQYFEPFDERYDPADFINLRYSKDLSDV